MNADTVQGTVSAVHADPYAMAFERGGESLWRELAALIRVEYRRHSGVCDGLFKYGDAELRIERI